MNIPTDILHQFNLTQTDSEVEDTQRYFMGDKNIKFPSKGDKIFITLDENRSAVIAEFYSCSPRYYERNMPKIDWQCTMVSTLFNCHCYASFRFDTVTFGELFIVCEFDPNDPRVKEVVNWETGNINKYYLIDRKARRWYTTLERALRDYREYCADNHYSWSSLNFIEPGKSSLYHLMSNEIETLKDEYHKPSWHETKEKLLQRLKDYDDFEKAITSESSTNVVENTLSAHVDCSGYSATHGYVKFQNGIRLAPSSWRSFSRGSLDVKYNDTNVGCLDALISKHFAYIQQLEEITTNLIDKCWDAYRKAGSRRYSVYRW